jgi:hypothetical protein
MNKWNKIKDDSKSLGEIPQEASQNLQAPELAPRDNRFTGRSKKMGLSAKPEFHQRLKILAAKENRLMVEILEEALELYEKNKKNQGI